MPEPHAAPPKNPPGQIQRSTLSAFLRRPFAHARIRRRGLFAEMASLADSVTAEHGAGAAAERTGAPRVLIAQIKAGAVLSGYSAVLAQALRLRGAEIGVLICGGGQPICEVGWGRRTYPFPCNRCTYFTETWAKAQRAPVFRISEGLPWGHRASRAPLAIPESANGGVDYVAATESSVPRFFLAAEHELMPFSEEVSRDFVISAYGVAQAVGPVLDEFAPDIVVMVNGLTTSEAVVKRLAELRGIRTVTYSSGMIPGTLFFSGDEPAERMNSEDGWRQAAGRRLTDEQEATIRAYLDGRSAGRGTYERYYRSPLSEGLLEELGVDPGARVVSVFSNITWDTACLNRNVGFESMRQWVLSTIELARAHPQTALIVRIHPDEVGWGSTETLSGAIAEAFPELPPNVRVVAPEESISSYALMDASDLVLTYTSTVGVEAAVRGIPVAVCGEAHYRGKGFTIDVEGPGDLNALLSGTAEEPTDPALALRYAFLFFHRLCIPFPAVEAKSAGLSAVDIDALERIPTRSEELAPGADPYVDFVCDRILGGGDFVLPEALVASA